MKLSITILTFNTKDITDTCIEKALIAKKYCEKNSNHTVEIIVVDNNSVDKTAEMVRKKYKDVKLIVNKVNGGVSVGYNTGLRAASNDSNFMLLLNSDLYLEEDTLLNCFEYMESHPKCDVLMCKLYNANHEFETYGGHIPTPLRTIGWLLGLESVPILKNHIAKIYGYNENLYKNDFQMEWAPTCFYFLKKEVFERTRGHDEKLFLYMEDLEWSKRIKDAGFKLWFTPKFTSTHLCGASTDKKLPKLYILKKQVEGVKYFQRKHYPKIAPLSIAFLYIGFTLRSILYSFTGNLPVAKIYLQSLSKSS